VHYLLLRFVSAVNCAAGTQPSRFGTNDRARIPPRSATRTAANAANPAAKATEKPALQKLRWQLLGERTEKGVESTATAAF
jgi:hypothetical protein